MVAYENTTCHTRIHVHKRECACALVCACEYINNEIAPFSRFFLSHYVHKSYIRAGLSDFFVMWDYFSVFICTGDVELCEVFDSHVKTEPSIIN